MSEFQEQPEQEYEGFRITDDSSAEWAVRKIIEAQRDNAKWQAHFNAQLARIQKTNEGTVNFMKSALAAYFADVPHKETKTSSKYELPSATLIRKQQDVDYQRDGVALLAYLDAQKMDTFVKVSRAPDWAALKPLTTINGDEVVLTETGEVIDGVKAIARPDKFDVQIKGEQHGEV